MRGSSMTISRPAYASIYIRNVGINVSHAKSMAVLAPNDRRNLARKLMAACRRLMWRRMRRKLYNINQLDNQHK